ncbi:hypothetical protein ACFVHB_27715 [Kitasatospora sp. NPDC127111]|uniref:hypothetical protein n=1 Tax=Kitasatospora sp. NPDC127111 TaxID=3345363 RepID=UPI003642D6DE
MLVEGLTALAAAGGAGIVQAAGTDVWAGLRERVARLLGRGRPETERVALERLDRTREALETAAPGRLAEVSERQAASWQTRLEDFLDDLAPTEQAQAAEQLRTLLDEAAATRATAAVRAENSGVTAGGSISNHGGAIGRDFRGPVTIGTPDHPTSPGAAPR